MTREKLYQALNQVLGEHFVNNCSLAIPELLEKAAVKIFYNCGEDGHLGHNSYLIRLAMYDLKEYGSIDFDPA